MEERVKSILQKHGCEFVSMLSECRVLWKNQKGIIRDDDVFTLFNISEIVWNFWKIF